MKDRDNNYWKAKLDDQSYKVLREAATEIPFSGKYNLHFKDGHYRCKGCDTVLFDSSSKFDSGCGWPSFDRAKKGSIKYKEDRSLMRIRTEILCSNCDGHLGHVFNDGPTETGMRYCVNSASINFENK